MPSLDEMRRAGYTVPEEESPVDKILSFVNGVDEQTIKQAEKRKVDQEDQIKLYLELRRQGYSEDMAHEKVSRLHRSTGFVEDLVKGALGDRDQFQRPDQEADLVGLERREKMADIGKTKAETRQALSRARAYDRGQAGGRIKDSWTPNQIQSYISFLTDEDRNPDYGTPENDEEITFARTRLRESAGFEPSGAGVAAEEQPPADAGRAQVERIPMVKPDGTKVMVAKTDVARARAKGYKDVRANA